MSIDFFNNDINLLDVESTIKELALEPIIHCNRILITGTIGKIPVGHRVDGFAQGEMLGFSR